MGLPDISGSEGARGGLGHWNLESIAGQRPVVEKGRHLCGLKRETWGDKPFALALLPPHPPPSLCLSSPWLRSFRGQVIRDPFALSLVCLPGHRTGWRVVESRTGEAPRGHPARIPASVSLCEPGCTVGPLVGFLVLSPGSGACTSSALKLCLASVQRAPAST